MKMAYYFAKAQQMDQVEHFPNMTPDDVREFVFLLKLEAMTEGEPFREDDLLVAWDRSIDFLSVFPLGDSTPDLLTNELLDTIKTQAYAQ